MIEITSKENKLIKDAIKLKQKKFRDLTNSFLVEGYKVIEEAVKNEYKILNVFVTENSYNKYKDFVNKFKNVAVLITSGIVNLLKSSVTSQEIFAVIENKQAKITNDNFVILDNIQDPSNLGAIFRVCAATNFKNIFMLNCVDSFNEKTIRSSMGNLFKLNLVNTNLNYLINYTKNKTVYSANMNGENLFKVKTSAEQIGVIFGNEGNGVSREVERLATKIISIPMQNSVESLNVSVSAGVILYNLSKF